jgi:putative heme-binding domain-containing protein
LILAAGGVFAQQRAYTPGDVEDGERLFLSNCAACHGPEGDAVPDVDLGHNKFRRASNDDGLKRIVKNGIPGTAMPPNNFTEFQLGVIVAYMHYMGDAASRGVAATGDAARGKAIFEGKGGCLACHRVHGSGSRLGPELSDIGSIRRAAELQQSLLEPDAEILPQNRSFRVMSKDGAATTGRLLNQDVFTVQIMDSKERLLSLQKSGLKEYGFIDKSPMPSYQGKLSPMELADVVTYLVSLKGIDKP